MSINLVASMVTGKKEIVNILDLEENESRVSFLRAEFNLESVEDFIKVIEHLFLVDCSLVEFTTNEYTREPVRVSVFAQVAEEFGLRWRRLSVLGTRASSLVVLGTTLLSFLVEQLSLRMTTPILCSLVSPRPATTSGVGTTWLSRRSRTAVLFGRPRIWESSDGVGGAGRLTPNSRARIKVCAALIASLCNLVPVEPAKYLYVAPTASCSVFWSCFNTM